MYEHPENIPPPPTTRKPGGGEWLPAFFMLLLAADILLDWMHLDVWRFVTKPLLMPVLLLWFLQQSGGLRSQLRVLIAAALVFSWLGDVLLMLEPWNSLFFMLGLGAFLLAHVFYILFFYRLLRHLQARIRSWIAIVLLAYYGYLLYLLTPHLEGLLWPVRVYGLVISVMLLLAAQFAFSGIGVAGIQMAIGALLFVISDSVLAINKFYLPFPAAGPIVMLTYGLAQWLIIKGILTYLQQAAPRRQ